MLRELYQQNPANQQCHYGEFDAHNAAAAGTLADVLRCTGQFSEAELLYRQAFSIDERFSAPSIRPRRMTFAFSRNERGICVRVCTPRGRE